MARLIDNLTIIDSQSVYTHYLIILNHTIIIKLNKSIRIMQSLIKRLLIIFKKKRSILSQFLSPLISSFRHNFLVKNFSLKKYNNCQRVCMYVDVFISLLLVLDLINK